MTSIPENNKISRLKTLLTSRNMIKNIAGLLIGAIAGFVYYRMVGCTSGTCAITSNPYMSLLWGGVLGYLVADMFRIKPKLSDSSEQTDQLR